MKWKHLAAGTAIAIACVLSGCAPVHRTTRAESDRAKTFEALPDKGIVYIYRNTFLGAFISMNVDIDHVRIGATGPNSFFKLALEPGIHTITSRSENTDSLNIDVKAGESYYVWQDVKMGIGIARTGVHLMSAEEGRHEIHLLKLLRTDNHQFDMPESGVAKTTPADAATVLHPVAPPERPAPPVVTAQVSVPTAPAPARQDVATTPAPAPEPKPVPNPLPTAPTPLDTGTTAYPENAIAATDARIGKPMFVVAQDLSSQHHCERLLRVRSVEGDDVHFYALCPSGGAPIEIHCNGTSCHEASPQG